MTLRTPGRLAEFVLLAFVLIFLWSWRLGSEYFVAHETAQVFDVLHLTYSQLVLHGELAGWAPYLAQGMPIDVWASRTLSPSMYLAMLIGWANGIRDVLFIFKVGVLFEQFCFLAGLFSLCSLIFARRISTIFVCIGAIAVLNPYSQIWWNFRLFYLVPACLAALVLFFQAQNALYLWATGLLAATALVGNRPELAPLYLYLLVAFAVPFTWRSPSTWLLALRPSRPNLCGAAAFAVVAGTLCWSQLATQAPLAASVDASRQASDLRDFLESVGAPNPFEAARQLIVGWPVFATWRGLPDIALYIGLLPWFLLPWAALEPAKRPAFIALVSTALLLLWLTMGGLGARLAYALPGMEAFRSIGYVHPMALQLLLVASGFGLEGFVSRGRAWHFLLLSVLAVLTIDAFGHRYLAGVAFSGTADVSPSFLFIARTSVYVMTGLICFVVVIARQRRRPWLAASVSSHAWLAVPLLLAFTADVLTYRRMSDYVVQPVPTESIGALGATAVAPIDFRAQRTFEYPAGRGRAAAALLEHAKTSIGDAKHGLVHSAHLFLRHDACETLFHVPWRLATVRALLQARPLVSAHSDLLLGHPPTRELDRRRRQLTPAVIDAWRGEAPDLMQILGCTASKLRIVRDAVWVQTTDAALRAVALGDRLAERVVLTGRPPSAVRARQPEPPSHEPMLRVRSFSANRLVVDASISTPGAAWLVYADADDGNWRATLDGVPVPILPAYAAFKAIQVAPGRHRVEFRYDRPLFRNPVLLAAVLATLVQLIALAFAALMALRSRTGPNAPPSAPGEPRTGPAEEASSP